MGAHLDVVGEKMGTATRHPEELVGGYDLVLAQGRSALEAMAAGAVLHEYAPAGVSDWSAAAVADGTATFTGYDAAGGRVAVLTASAAGIDLRTLYPEAAFRWPIRELPAWSAASPLSKY